MNLVGFPRLGLGPFSISHTAFSIGFLSVQWYGIIIVLGMALACLYAFWRMKSVPLVVDDMLDIALVCIPSGIVGARLYYVLTSLENYPAFWDVFKIWEGGLAIYGGIIGGFIGIFAVCRHKKKSLLRVLDCIAPGVMIGQLIGRWGNFVNAEAYGYSAGVEKLPWRMTVGTVYIDGVPHPEIEFVHPTFLYESLWNLLGFIVINLFYRHKKRDGQVFYLYVAWYGLGRGLLEFLRTDSLRIFGYKAFVILGLGSFVIAVILLIVSYRRAAAEREEIEAYTSANPTPVSVPATENTLDIPVDYDHKDDNDESDEKEGEDNGDHT